MKITSLPKLSAVVIALSIFETIGQVFLHKFFKEQYNPIFWYYPFIAWLLYGLNCYLLLIGYNYSDLSAVETLWDAGTTILVPLVGMLFFKEQINFTSGLGIFVTLIGIVLIMIGSSDKGPKLLKNSS